VHDLVPIYEENERQQKGWKDLVTLADSLNALIKANYDEISPLVKYLDVENQ
jgi:hypothetical protein